MKFMPCHQYQRERCQEFGGKILNVASKEDPANLSEFGATNMDVMDFDIETKQNLYDIPNFVQGSALDIPFEPETFDVVVLGEFLEHLLPHTARRALLEAKRVLRKNGKIVLTFPRDHRPPEAQRPKNELIDYGDEITSWHQYVWEEDDLESLFYDVGLREVAKYSKDLRYAICDWKGQQCWGCGKVLEKRNV